MPSARFGFGILPLTAYRPAAGRVDRVSLAWWDGGSADPGPVFDGDPSRQRTLVVVWPTDAAGYLLPDTLEQGLVLTWTMDAATFRTLDRLHRDWPLGRHDLWVRGGVDVHVAPCANCLLDPASRWAADMREQVSSAEGRLEGRSAA